jgi:hypothetical protein
MEYTIKVVILSFVEKYSHPVREMAGYFSLAFGAHPASQPEISRKSTD